MQAVSNVSTITPQRANALRWYGARRNAERHEPTASSLGREELLSEASDEVTPRRHVTTVVAAQLDGASHRLLDGMVGGLEAEHEQASRAGHAGRVGRLHAVEQAAVRREQARTGRSLVWPRHRRRSCRTTTPAEARQRGRSCSRIHASVMMPRLPSEPRKRRSGDGPAPEPGRRRDSLIPDGVTTRIDSTKSSMCVYTRGVVAAGAGRQPATERRQLERLREVPQRQPVRAQLLLERRARARRPGCGPPARPGRPRRPGRAPRGRSTPHRRTRHRRRTRRRRPPTNRRRTGWPPAPPRRTSRGRRRRPLRSGGRRRRRAGSEGHRARRGRGRGTTCRTCVPPDPAVDVEHQSAMESGGATRGGRRSSASERGRVDDGHLRPEPLGQPAGEAAQLVVADRLLLVSPSPPRPCACRHGRASLAAYSRPR